MGSRRCADLDGAVSFGFGAEVLGENQCRYDFYGDWVCPSIPRTVSLAFERSGISVGTQQVSLGAPGVHVIDVIVPDPARLVVHAVGEDGQPLPPPFDARQVFEEARREGALVSPSPLFGLDGRGQQGLRMSFCAESPARLEMLSLMGIEPAFIKSDRSLVSLFETLLLKLGFDQERLNDAMNRALQALEPEDLFPQLSTQFEAAQA